MEQLLGQLTISLILLSHQIDNVELIKTAEASTIESAQVVCEQCEPLPIKDKVALAFKDDPRMVNVAYCESRHRQFDDKGNPLISPTSDVGVMQINQLHWSRAKKLGLDIFNSVDDNIKMGRIIYDEQSITAWYALKSDCYKKLSGTKT